MSRARTLGELGAVYALLLAIVWDFGAHFEAEGRVETLLGVGVAGIVAASWWRKRITLDALGLAPPCWRRGWSLALGVSLLGAGLLVAAGVALGSASLAATRFAWLGDYALGIVGQQLLLQGFFAPGIARLGGAWRESTGVAAAALAFAGLHAPNPALVLGTLCAGAFWILLFRRHRNLPALLASHLLLGSAAMASLGPGPLLNLRVGAGALALLGR